MAQAVWAQTSFAERRRVLATMQQYIVGHMEEIARVCSRDSGKPSAYWFGGKGGVVWLYVCRWVPDKRT